MGRKQKVVLNNHEPKRSSVLIPQGCVLGPILFNTYASDIPSIVNSLIFQFADDVKVFRTIRSVEDVYQLQCDVNMLFASSKKWLLKFNISKCNWLHLGPPNGYSEYLINGTTIASCKIISDLGLLIDNQLKFHNHTTAVAKKANRILAVIHKTFQYFDHNTFINLHKSYICPVLEYGNIICGPRYILDQELIEKVQRRATRLMYNLQNRTYNNHQARTQKVEMG